MEFTGLAVLANSAVVVDSVGGVGILLDLSNEDSLAYCMQSSALNKEHVALVYRNVVCNFKQSIVSDALRELLLAYLVLEAVEKLRAGVAVNDVPHLGLAVLALYTQCVLI